MLGIIHSFLGCALASELFVLLILTGGKITW